MPGFHIHLNKWLVVLVVGMGFLTILWSKPASAQVEQPTTPQGRHCIGAGPLPASDPEFCGCTWGQIYFDGQAVVDADVALQFGGGKVESSSKVHYAGEAPFYSLSAFELGAKRGDVMTLTVSFASQTITRTLRAWPDANGEQHVAAALSDDGVWSDWLSGGYTATLAIDDETLWAGGLQGVRSLNLNTALSQTHTLSLANTQVRALAVGSNHQIWAAGPGGVAQWSAGGWQPHTLPLAGEWSALAVNAVTGEIWLGGKSGDQGKLLAYDGSWRVINEPFAGPIVALAIDAQQKLWASVWGRGVVRNDNGTWTPYRLATGFLADYIHTIAVENSSGSSAVWFGARPFFANNQEQGGIVRYELTTNRWFTYTADHGLPADAILSKAPASVYTILPSSVGVWAGTTAGVYRLTGAQHWLLDSPQPPPAVFASAGNTQTLVIATANGLYRWQRNKIQGTPPTASFEQTAFSALAGSNFTLSGIGVDNDEEGKQIVSWSWLADGSIPLCTTPQHCTLPARILGEGIHTVELRVQDDEGIWSAPATAQLIITPGDEIFLPAVLR
jgi:hypothetical protein